MIAPNTILQNRYLVRRELGHGGMGTVYEALDQRLNCVVALKETTAGNSEEARRAFEREASLLGNLRHSALPKVMDYFSEGESDFLVMEFIPGEDLAAMIDAHGRPFPQSQVLRWADEVLKVLEYLHGQQPPILHRDIKPSNLKLTHHGEIFLLDFGLAKGTAGGMATAAASRSVFGYTPVYASLEQILGQGTDPRSDLYSVGATLYHLLSGSPPADAPARFAAMEEDRPDPLEPIEKLNSNALLSVTAVVHRALAINRRHRPADAGEMRRAVQRALIESEAFETEQRDKVEATETIKFEETPVPPTVIADVKENYSEGQVTQPSATRETSPREEIGPAPIPTIMGAPPPIPRENVVAAVPLAPPLAKRKSKLLPIGIGLGVLAMLVIGTVIALLMMSNRSRLQPITLTAEDMSLIATDQTPQVRARLATDEAARKEFAKNVRELIAVTAEARSKGIADRPEIKRQVELLRAFIIAQNYRSANSVTISDGEIDLFFKEPGQEERLKQFIKDAQERNPTMKDQQISDDQLKEIRRQLAEVRIGERRGIAAGIDKQRKVELQIMLQEARLLASTFEQEILTKSAKATQAEIDAYVKAHPEEQVHARHILIAVKSSSDSSAGALDKPQARAKAQDLLRRLRAGEDFATLAKEYSMDPGSKESGGDLGWFGKGRMVPEFEKAAFALQTGQISEVVESSFGFHIIKVEERRGADQQAATTAVEQEKAKALIDEIAKRYDPYITVAENFVVTPPPESSPTP